MRRASVNIYIKTLTPLSEFCPNCSDWLNKYFTGTEIWYQKTQIKKKISESTSPRAFIFGILHYLEVLYQCCSNYAHGVLNITALGNASLHLNFKCIRNS